MKNVVCARGTHRLSSGVYEFVLHPPKQIRDGLKEKVVSEHKRNGRKTKKSQTET